MASKFARGAALLEVSRGIGKFGDIFGQAMRDREQRKLDAPFRELQLKQAQQGVAAGERKAAEATQIDEDERRFQEIQQEISARPGLQKKFQAEIAKGIEETKPEFDPTAEQPAFQEPAGPVQGPREDMGPEPKPYTATEQLEQLSGLAGSKSDLVQAERGRLQEVVEKEQARELELSDIESQREFQKEQQKAGFAQQDKSQKAGQDFTKEERLARQKFDSAQAIIKREQKQNDDKLRPLSGEASKILGLVTSGVDGAKTLIKKLESEDLDFFDTSKFLGVSIGSFKNPEAALALEQASETLGRLNSGGAINPDELKTFRKLIANRDYLVTKEGRKAVLDNLRKFVQRGIQTGIDITGNRNFEAERLGGVGGGSFGSEEEARAAGKKTGDEIRITGVGLVRLN